MLIEEHIKLINALHHCPDIDQFHDFADINDITLYQGKEATEVFIDNRHYLVIGLFSGATLDIIKAW